MMKRNIKIFLSVLGFLLLPILNVEKGIGSEKNKYNNKIDLDVIIKANKEIKFKDIEEVIEKNNLELKRYKIKIDQDKYLLKSKLAAWYPRLSLTSSGLPKYLDGSTKNNSDSSNDTLSKQLSTSLSAEIKWDLINPLRNPEINAAKDRFEKSKLNYLVNLRELKLKALKEYYKLQQANEDVKIAKKSIEYSEISLNEAKIRFKSGVGTKLEVLEAETQLARDVQLLNQKIGEKNINQRSFAEILNLPSNINPIITEEAKVIGIWETSLEESIIASYYFRQELNKLLLDISINKNNANKARAAKRPTFSLFNTVSTSFAEGERLVTSPNMNKSTTSLNNTIGISAKWNLIDGGKTKALYKYNKAKEKESRNEYKIQLAKIRKEVETSYFNLTTSYQDIKTTYKEVKSAQESLRLAKLRFNSGITTQREVVNNQRDLTDAKVKHVRSITNYNISLSDIQRKTGINKIKTCKNAIKDILSNNNKEKSNYFIMKNSSLVNLCKE